MAQSVSVCVPTNAKRCINDCKTCCVKMHTSKDVYENTCYKSLTSHIDYLKNFKDRLEYTREKGCDVCILTGYTEPQQDKNFLKEFYLINQSLSNPFRNIEIQTTGATIDLDALLFLKEIGLKTLAISTFCLDSDRVNREITRTCDEKLSVKTLCDNAKALGLNVRLCLNINDYILHHHDISAETIFDYCEKYHADQVTFRKMWNSNDGSEQSRWIYENCTCTDRLLREIKDVIKKNGELIGKLEYGASIYSYRGFSTVIDEDSMAKDESNNATKYYIIRQNGKLYSNWDNAGSLIF